MSDLSRIQEDINSLPAEVQQTIFDFVNFLKQKHQTNRSEPPQSITFEDQPFVGMWSDLPEMRDSADWVHQTRTQQWQR